MAGSAAIIIAVMKPSARILRRQRRFIPVLAACIAAAQGVRAEDLQCGVQAVDPRLEELLKADPDDPRIDITSDHGDLGRAGDASLSGNVRIRMGQRLLTADSAQLDANQRSVRLEGTVEYLDPTLHVRGQGGEFAGTAGSFEGAEFELTDRGVRGAAKDVQLHDESIIDLDGVSYTACPPGNDDWMLRAGEISIDQESRIGTGRNVRLDFKGATVLYTPWITFPVGDVRKSGLLFPTIGNGSKTGTQVTVPWYWNIAPNYDATFTTRYFSQRGVRVDPEFRYLTERSHGVLDVEYLFDDKQTGDPRTYIDLQHVTRVSAASRVRIDAGYASDNNYFEDFGVGYEGTSVTFLNRLVEARNESEHWSLTGRVQNYQILDPELSDSDAPYSILPQVAAVGRWRDLAPGLGATLHAEATYFDRDTGVTGARLDVEPVLDWRAESRGAYVAAGAAWRATSYALSNTAPGADESLLRSVPTLSAETGMVFERQAGSSGKRLQTLEPRALYLYVPYRDQDDLPVFDTALPDLNLVQLFRTNRYVGPDRVGDANQLSVGLTSRLLDAVGGRQYLSATLGQAIYLEDPRVRLPDEPERNRRTSDLVAELDLSAFKNWSARLGYQWNPDASQTEKAEFYLQYRPASDRVVNAGYRFRQDQLEQVDVSAAWPIGSQWRGFGRWVYSLYEDKTLDQFIGFEYSSCCWALRVVTRRFVSSRTGDSDTSVGLQLELKGLSNVGVDNEAFLRDAIRGYSPILPDARP
jgi:LPS-assembly protein